MKLQLHSQGARVCGLGEVTHAEVLALLDGIPVDAPVELWATGGVRGADLDAVLKRAGSRARVHAHQRTHDPVARAALEGALRRWGARVIWHLGEDAPRFECPRAPGEAPTPFARGGGGMGLMWALAALMLLWHQRHG
jgi:hypothetical protein